MPTNYNGYTIPSPTDIADAPAAFEEFSDSIPFSEYVAIESLSADTTVVDSYNGKMIFATADLTLTFGTLTDGFSVAVTADTGVTVDYLGVDKVDQETTAYQIASVIAVNGTNIISISGGLAAVAPCPECPECPPVPEPLVSANFTDEPTGTYTDGFISYKYLILTGTTTVTFDKSGVADVLVVAGGGGGSRGGDGGDARGGGGGGAGGFLALTDLAVPVGEHTIIVGAGGGAYSPGNDSSFAGTSTAIGGGNGGSVFGQNIAAGAGGSGGGGGRPGAIGAAGTLGQGFDGGAPTTGGGGGGGGSEAGGNGTASQGGAGGAGQFTVLTGSVMQLAGGGGGGTGYGPAGAGGGGMGSGNGVDAASSGTPATAGVVSTGGGGGGSRNYSYSTAKPGGSGIVIIRVVV